MEDKKLMKLMRGMDVPSYRVEKLNLSNLTWLGKNLEVRNSGHPNFNKVSNEISLRLKNKVYVN